MEAFSICCFDLNLEKKKAKVELLFLIFLFLYFLVFYYIIMT